MSTQEATTKEDAARLMFLIAEYEVGAARGCWLFNQLGLRKLWTWLVYRRITVKTKRWLEFREMKHKHELRP